MDGYLLNSDLPSSYYALRCDAAWSYRTKAIVQLLNLVC